MLKKILVTGASGLIGRNLCRILISRGDDVSIFTRDIYKTKNLIPGAKEYIKWDYKNPSKWAEYLNNKDAVIHLAGANLFAKRWTENYKKIIFNSRIDSTESLVEAIGSVLKKPAVFICASGSTYYGDSGNRVLTEENGPGNNFSAKVSLAWENAALKVEKYNIRRVSIRSAAVLSIEDGALKVMLPFFKFFIGGPLGNGTQWFPWIHIEDIINVYLYALDNISITGAINASTPNPTTMNEFASTLGKLLHKPSFFKVPRFLLEIAVGEVTEVVTDSIKIIPQKLLDNGFKFKFDNLKEALKDLVL
jgi:uncharacterized protein